MIAKRERQGASAWRVKGKSPFMYLQSSDLVAGASNGVGERARLLLAPHHGLRRLEERNQVATAGSKSINLLAELKKLPGHGGTGPTRARSPRSPAP